MQGSREALSLYSARAQDGPQGRDLIRRKFNYKIYYLILEHVQTTKK